jgi:hypothetical protein
MLVLRVGLAVLFAANALVAWITPEEFTTLVADAGVDRLVDSQVILWGIRLNDFAVCVRCPVRLEPLAAAHFRLGRPLHARRRRDQGRRTGLNLSRRR